MTTLRLRAPLPTPDAINAVRATSEPVAYDDATGEYILTFTPDLTPAEQAALEDAVSLARSYVTFTAEEWARIKPEVQTLRALRQLGRNAFMQLAAADRDRMIYDVLVAQTIIDLALLRDT
jgi:hypothetical protein